VNTIHLATNKALAVAATFAGLGICLLIGGCASSRLYATPRPITTPELAIVSTSPDGITATLSRIVHPNGGGSWVRNAAWDEYIVCISNGSPDNVILDHAELQKTALHAPVPAGASQGDLARESSDLGRTLKDAGLVGGTSLGAAGVAAAAAGTGGGFVSAAAVAAAVALPIALIGGTSYVVSRHHRAREDKPRIDHQLVERGLALPAQLGSATRVSGSLFFPVVPAPDALVIAYESAGGTRELLVPLAQSTVALKRAPPTVGARSRSW
jgi:hypothetical protein